MELSSEKKLPKWKALILASRPPFLQVTLSSVMAGILIAWIHQGAIDAFLAVLVVLVAVFLHLSVNLIHEYWDWKSGTDNINVNAFRPFTGGSGMIQLGAISPTEELVFGLSLMFLGAILGIYILIIVHEALIPLLLIGFIAIFSIIFYTGSPIKLAHRGVGEFFVFLNFGPLMALGAYIVLTRNIHLEPVIVGSLIGLLTAGILIINEFPDAEADEKAGKKHLVVRLGLAKARYLYAIVMILPYILTVTFALMHMLPITILITLLGLPHALKIVRICFRYYNDFKALFPANIGTIKNHLIYSLLVIIAYLITGFFPITFFY